MTDESSGIAELENGGAAQKLYDLILQGANHFLYNCSTFTVATLAGHNPTYEEIARMLGTLVLVINDLSDSFDAMMGTKAAEYCFLMQKMSIAIKNKDQEELSNLVVEMKGKTGS